MVIQYFHMTRDEYGHRIDKLIRRFTGFRDWIVEEYTLEISPNDAEFPMRIVMANFLDDGTFDRSKQLTEISAREYCAILADWLNMVFANRPALVLDQHGEVYSVRVDLDGEVACYDSDNRGTRLSLFDSLHPYSPEKQMELRLTQ